MRTSFVTYACLAASFAGLMALNVASSKGPSKKEKSYFVPPPNQIHHLGFGYEESLADSLWLRYIQGLDVCQKYEGLSQTLQDKGVFERDGGFNKEKVVGFIEPIRHKNCDGSWAFLMLDAITQLAPRFRMPYAAGAVALSVIVEDYKGAQVIFDRALENYPDDWSLNYKAAYHYLYDLNNLERAAELLEHAAKNGAPTWTRALAGKIYTRAGQGELAIRVLVEHLKEVENEKRREELLARIEQAKKLLQEDGSPKQ